MGEAKQIEWSQVHLDEALIRLEGEQTKNEEPRTVRLPDVLLEILKKLPKKGQVLDATNLRKAWHKAGVAAGFGTLTKVEGKTDPRYDGLIIHDLRRSAIKNLIKAGVNEKVAMSMSGHKTRDVFDATTSWIRKMLLMQCIKFSNFQQRISCRTVKDH